MILDSEVSSERVKNLEAKEPLVFEVFPPSNVNGRLLPPMKCSENDRNMSFEVVGHDLVVSKDFYGGWSVLN